MRETWAGNSGWSRRAAITAAVAAGIVTAGPHAGAQERDFYAGRTISIIVGYSAGGGYDLYSRLLARHVGRHIPGQPTIVVQNMPGAASLTAVRYLAATAPKDGTAITIFDPAQILEALTGPERVNVRFADYQWLGSMQREIPICYAGAATGIRTFDDMMKRKEFIIGLTQRGSTAYVSGVTLKKVFNAPIRQISGYPGSNEQRMAVERGELEGNCSSWSAMPQDWIVNKKMNTLVRLIQTKPPDMPAEVPFINDLATSADQKTLLDVLNAPAALGRPFIVSGEVPRARLSILRAGLQAALKDPQLLEEASRAGMGIEPVTGEEAEGIVRTMHAAAPATIAKVKEVMD
jgi:tripartite-type tricarboxylate transporter receptor subunit TctC